MKKVSKITSIVLSLVLALSCFVILVACKKGDDPTEKAIEMYILPQDGTLLTADFSLPKTIGSADEPVEVTWTSDNENAIKIEDNGTAYKAKVTLQSAVTDVKLTVSAGKASKSFVVRVDELSIYTFIDRYSFPQKLTAVTNDFELDQSVTIQDKTASIAWSVEDDASKEYIKVEDDKCVVNLPDDDIKDVKLHALFSCEGLDPASTFVDYPFSVSPPYDHQQLVNRRFSIEGDPLELSGYIVYVGEASASFGNATFWMVDDDFCSGYYLYRVKVDADQIEKVVPGAHVKVSGDTTKSWNGLWENNSGGKAVIDSSEPIDMSEHVYDFDTDLLSDAPSALWHQSTMVKLSGWKVKSLPNKPTGSDSDLMTLTRDGKDIKIRLSKYVFTDTDERKTALDETIALWDTLSAAMEKGDVYVDVVGLLGYFSGHQIQPVQASDITIVQSEGTNNQAAAIKAALDAVKTAVDANFATAIVENKTVEMPTSHGDVAISYKVCGIKEGSGTVTIEGGNFEIAPINELKNYEIKVIYTLDDYTAYSFFKLPNQKLDDQGIVGAVKDAIESKTLPEVKATGDVDLPSVDAMGAVISWSIENKPDWVTIGGNKITVNALPAESTTLTVVATISLNGQEATAKLTLSVSAAATEVFQAIEAPAAGKYVFSMMKKGTRYYASSLELDSGDEGYIQTSDDPSKAVQLELVKHGDSGWYIKMGEKYLEINPYENPNSGKTSYKLKLVAQPTADWKWRETEKIFAQSATEVTGDNPATNDFYIGTYDDSSFTTMSPSNVSYIEGDKAANLDVSQHPARFGSILPGSGSQGGGGSQGGTTPEPTDPNVINITVDTLTFGKGYNTEEETGELNGVTFGWIGVMHNTYEGATQNSIQGRSDRNSAFYTKTALPNALKTIRLHMAGTNGYSNEHVFYATFATSFEGLSASDVATVTMDTVEGVTEYTITAPEGNWTFVKLTWGDAHASYWKSIELVLDGAGSGTTSGGSQGSTEPGGTTPGGTTPGGTTPGGSQSGGQNVPLTSPVTIKSNQTATTNLTGTDDKEKFDFSSGKDLFTIVGTKVSGNNNVGLNKDGTIRLYKNGSATLTISIANGYVIDSITIKYQTRNTYGDNMVQPTVMVGDDSITATGAATTIDEYNSSLTWNINAQSFVITDTDSADQVRIVEIVVTCHKAA